MFDIKSGVYLANLLEAQFCCSAFSRYDPFTKILYYDVGWISTSFTNVLDLLVCTDVESETRYKIISYLSQHRR